MKFLAIVLTIIFAIARIVGWSAHRIEELVAGGKLMRPAYKSAQKLQEYIPIADRSSTLIQKKSKIVSKPE